VSRIYPRDCIQLCLPAPFACLNRRNARISSACKSNYSLSFGRESAKLNLGMGALFSNWLPLSPSWSKPSYATCRIASVASGVSAVPVGVFDAQSGTSPRPALIKPAETRRPCARHMLDTGRRRANGNDGRCSCRDPFSRSFTENARSGCRLSVLLTPGDTFTDYLPMRRIGATMGSLSYRPDDAPQRASDRWGP